MHDIDPVTLGITKPAVVRQKVILYLFYICCLVPVPAKCVNKCKNVAVHLQVANLSSVCTQFSYLPRGVSLCALSRVSTQISTVAITQLESEFLTFSINLIGVNASLKSRQVLILSLSHYYQTPYPQHSECQNAFFFDAIISTGTINRTGVKEFWLPSG